MPELCPKKLIFAHYRQKITKKSLNVRIIWNEKYLEKPNFYNIDFFVGFSDILECGWPMSSELAMAKLLGSPPLYPWLLLLWSASSSACWSWCSMISSPSSTHPVRLWSKPLTNCPFYWRSQFSSTASNLFFPVSTLPCSVS